MILLVCVDDGMGMAFAGRRQSRDRLLRKRILEKTAGGRLWMSGYSARQFAEDDAPQVCVTGDAFCSAGAGEYCFVETIAPLAMEAQIEEIILFRWNRKYPADLFFNIPLEEHGWKLRTYTEFAGQSHAHITEEVYTR